MHLLATTTASLESLAEPVDLAQAPAEMVALSFSDSDLAALAAAWDAGRAALPSLRLAALRDLRHPMSVDLWLEKTAAHAKVVLVRLLGGYDWWAYGCERLAAMAREKGVVLALLPGESRQRDERLMALSTVSSADHDALLRFFHAGGPENMAGALALLARLAGGLEPHYTPEAFPSVAIIAPYKEQIQVLKEQLEHVPVLQPYRDRITVNTVDSFQGQERDIVYISMTRSNTEGSIGFLSDIRRMNVAMTRARKKLVVVGDSATLCQHPFYAGFMTYTEGQNAYQSAWEYADL